MARIAGYPATFSITDGFDSLREEIMADLKMGDTVETENGRKGVIRGFTPDYGMVEVEIETVISEAVPAKGKVKAVPAVMDRTFEWLPVSILKGE